ncbi:hypothetical protein HPB47_015973 [Ixodes persulcatus]|uniref:Uncharacterized protein n=1 Tax=Ixodes persulcatus TaxID=34615 RepID=A0AC60QS19_IXOPE|nr:hypothetical protein HPB47_015973 [Ixodes persulcatus]
MLRIGAFAGPLSDAFRGGRDSTPGMRPRPNHLLFVIQVLSSWVLWPTDYGGFTTFPASYNGWDIIDETACSDHVGACGFPLPLSSTSPEPSCNAPFANLVSGRDSTPGMRPRPNHLLFVIQCLLGIPRPSSSASNLQILKALTTTCKETAKKSKQDYLQRLEDTMKTNNKQHWKFMKLCGNDQMGIPDIMVHGELLTDAGQKACVFNNYFKSVFLPPEETTLEMCSSNYDVMPPVEISMEGVFNLLGTYR